MRPTDRYCHALNFTLFVGGPDVIGAMKVGALTIWAGTIPSDRLLSIFQTWRPTVTWTTPSYAWFLGETAKERGIDPAESWQSAPIVWLLAVGCGLVAIAMASLISFSGGKPGGVYHPPSIVDGVIKPSRIE